MLAAGVWSVPVVALAVSAPLVAASAPVALEFVVTRFPDNGTYRDYRVDFSYAGALPSNVTVEWTPTGSATWGVSDQSVNLNFVGGDFVSSAVYLLTGSTSSFWLQTQSTAVTNIPSYVVSLIDSDTSSVIASATVTFTGEEPFPG